MAESNRRIILRPPGVDDARWRRLGELLKAAVARQHDLSASSAHVLRFLGDLTELPDRSGYAIEHEPATAMPVGPLFNPSGTLLQPTELLRVTVALFDAMRAAHAGGDSGARPTVHGGISPGVILFTRAGVTKISDFGFAPAVCEALGPEQYVNLAVGPRDEGRHGPADIPATGVWEVLKPDELSRDDRICAFIDPEKYGRHEMNAFESGSDIISAGFVVHLLAEHEHPYLPGERDAHRMVEMSEFMAMSRYNGARRQDLRESADEGVRLWNELIALTLTRTPQDRPAAARVVEALASHVTLEDAGVALRREIDSLEQLARDDKWDDVRKLATDIAKNKGAPVDVVQRANALMAEAQARTLIAEARVMLSGGNWSDAAQPMETVLAMSGLRPELTQEASVIADTVNRNLTALRLLDDAESAVMQVNGSDAVTTAAVLEGYGARLKELTGEDWLLPPIRSRFTGVSAKVSGLLAEALPEAQAFRESEQAQASEWLERLESLFAAQSWDELDAALGDRPRLSLWPKGTLERAHEIRLALDDHLAEHQWDVAREADHKAAQAWMEQLRAAVEQEDWESAQQIVDQKPRLTYWPAELVEESTRLSANVRMAFRIQEQYGKARQWADRVRQAVAASDWDAGASLLKNRPDAAQCPHGLMDEIAGEIRQIEEHFELTEKERREVERNLRMARSWVDRAEDAGRQENWEEALDILAAPPPLPSIPDEVRDKARTLTIEFRNRLGDEILKQLNARTGRVQKLADELVGGILSAEYAGMIDLKSIKVEIDAQELACDSGEGDGRAILRIRSLTPYPEAAKTHVETPINYAAMESPGRLLGEEALRTRITKELVEMLDAFQRVSLLRLETTLRAGFFPRAEVKAEIVKPTGTLPASIALFGPQAKDKKIDAELRWDAIRLAWDFADRKKFGEQTIGYAANAVNVEFRKKLLELSEQLRRYESHLSIETVPAGGGRSAMMASTLELEGRVGIKDGSPIPAQPLQTFELSCTHVGNIPLDLDPSPAEAKLRQIVVEAQQASQAAMKAEVQSRIDATQAPIKLSCLPSKIELPVDRILLRLEGGGPMATELAATWEPARCAFVPTGPWKAKLEQVLGAVTGSVGAAVVMLPPKGARVEPQEEESATTAGALPKWPVIGVAAALLIAVVAWVMWPDGDKNGNGSLAKTDPNKSLQNTGLDNPKDDPAKVDPGPKPQDDPKGNGGGGNGDNPSKEPVDNKPPTNGGGTSGGPDDPTGTTGTTDPNRQNKEPVDNNPPDKDPVEEQRLAELRALGITLDELNKRVTDELPKDLTDETVKPKHDVIAGLITNQDVDNLIGAIDELLARIPADAAELRSDANRLRILLAEEYKPPLDAYSQILNLEGKTVKEITAAFQSAQEAFDTEYVANVMTKLPEVEQSMQHADKWLADNWRATVFYLDQADAIAADAGLGELLEPVITAKRDELADFVYAAVQPALADGRQWLQQVGDASEGFALLSETDRAEEARVKVRNLDLDFPARPKGQDIATAAIEQRLLPWTRFSDEEIDVATRLLDWTVARLPIAAADGSAAATIEVSFIPAPPAYDAFWISMSEITADQYRSVTGGVPEAMIRTPQGDKGAEQGRLPVVFISATDATAFCKKLEGKLNHRVLVTPPNADEWLHADSLGTNIIQAAYVQSLQYGEDGIPTLDPTQFNFESDEAPNLILAPGYEDGFAQQAPVMSYLPNRWLLYGMRGNVQEWVQMGAGSRLGSIGGGFNTRLDDPPTFLTAGNRDQARNTLPDVGIRVIVRPKPGA